MAWQGGSFPVCPAFKRNQPLVRIKDENDGRLDLRGSEKPARDLALGVGEQGKVKVEFPAQGGVGLHGVVANRI